MRKTCLDSVFKIAKKNKKIIFIGSDLGPGVLDNFKNEIPKRFFMEGVSEQHIIGMSAGMALNGFIPYVNTIGTFITRRCYEQLIIDLSLHNLPVRLIGNGGGLVYAPLGPTHQAIDDIGIMRIIPNMKIICPCDSNEMKKLMRDTVHTKGPVYIRLAKGGDEIVTNKFKNINLGKAIKFGKTKNILIISTGIMTQVALKIRKKFLEKKIECSVLHLGTIKPLDIKSLKKNISDSRIVFTLEEHVLNGGFGSSILEFCSDNMKNNLPKINRFGLNNNFVEKYGSQEELLKYFNLDANTLYKKMLRRIKKNES